MFNHNYMKKILLLGLSILSVLVFVACGSLSDIDPGVSPTELIGVLTVQSSDDSLAGTHIITDDFGVDTPVRSVAINLTNSQYLNNKVSVMGTLSSDDDVFNVTGITVLKKISSKKNLEPEFKEYKNTDLGFKFKYYTDWELIEGHNSVSFSAPLKDLESDEEIEVDQIVVEQFPYSYEKSVFDTDNDNSPLKSYLADNYPEIVNFDDLLNAVGVDDLESLKIETEDGSVNYYFYRNGFIYLVSFRSSLENFNEENKKIFNEMINEFQFTGFTLEDNGDISDLDLLNENLEEDSDSDSIVVDDFEIPVLDQKFTEFESSSFSFRGSYPSNWYYQGVNSDDPSVRREYIFSKNEISDDGSTEAAVVLDLVSGNFPKEGKQFNNGNFEITIIDNGDDSSMYFSVDSKTYHIYGNKEYKDIMINMASMLSPLSDD